MKMIFEYFQIQKWMLQKVRAKKIDEKNGVVCLVSLFPSCVWSLNCLKKCSFCNFALSSAGKLSLLKQFTYMHLKSLVMHFQKMVMLIMLWLTVLEISGFEIEDFCWVSADSASFLIFYLLISCVWWLRPL